MLPQDIIEYIGYLSSIDARLALGLKPRKIPKHQIEELDRKIKKRYDNLDVTFVNNVAVLDNWFFLREQKLLSISILLTNNSYSFVFCKCNDNMENIENIRVVECNDVIRLYSNKKNLSSIYYVQKNEKPMIDKLYEYSVLSIKNTPYNKNLFHKYLG